MPEEPEFLDLWMCFEFRVLCFLAVGEEIFFIIVKDGLPSEAFGIAQHTFLLALLRIKLRRASFASEGWWA